MPPTPEHKKFIAQEGMVLLVTLSAMAFLVPLVYAGVESQRFHLRQVQQELNLEIAHRQAESLLALVVRILAMDGVQNSMTDHLNELWAMPIPLPDNEEGTTEAVVEDTARRINLNALRKSDGQLNPDMHQLLLHLFAKEEISSRLLANLIDWLNPLDPAQGNKPLHAMEELLQVPDWDLKTLQKLQPYLTVDEQCRNSQLNLNTADIKTLELLDPNQNWQQVVKMRKESPITQVADLAKAGVTLSPGMTNLVTINSSCFVINIRARVNTVAGTLTAWMVRNTSQVTITKMRWKG